MATALTMAWTTKTDSQGIIQKTIVPANQGSAYTNNSKSPSWQAGARGGFGVVTVVACGSVEGATTSINIHAKTVGANATIKTRAPNVIRRIMRKEPSSHNGMHSRRRSSRHEAAVHGFQFTKFRIVVLRSRRCGMDAGLCGRACWASSDARTNQQLYGLIECKGEHFGLWLQLRDDVTLSATDDCLGSYRSSNVLQMNDDINTGDWMLAKRTWKCEKL